MQYPHLSPSPRLHEQEGMALEFEERKFPMRKKTGETTQCPQGKVIPLPRKAVRRREGRQYSEHRIPSCRAGVWATVEIRGWIQEGYTPRRVSWWPMGCELGATRVLSTRRPDRDRDTKPIDLLQQGLNLLGPCYTLLPLGQRLLLWRKETMWLLRVRPDIGAGQARQ